MLDPAEFDAFYAATRGRLLLQTYALTGDLPAARSAVRDAFIAAWHHWRKVSRLDDPESWVRPHAWSLAQRHHTTRIWHRDKALDDASRATLEALGKLSLPQRKVLLLTQLSSVNMEQMAREIGLTRETAERELQTAAAQFSLHRNVPSPSVRLHLEALGAQISSSRFPRVTIIRRSGAARRRAHTGVGVVAAVAALLAAGAVVHQTGGATPALGGVSAHGDSSLDEPDPATLLHPDDLLTSEQISTLAPARTLKAPVTSNNTGGTGINTVCQEEPFADPQGEATLVRKFALDGEPSMTALQSLELSTDDAAAHTAYDTVVGWYAGCTERRAQLLSTHRLNGVGDEAVLLVLRTWQAPEQTLTIGVARTGALVSTVVRQFQSTREPRLEPMVGLTATAVEGLCTHEAAAACVTTPKAVPIPPPAGVTARGLLQEVDLPPVEGVTRPWAGTGPAVPRANMAATTCDNTEFTSKQISYATTRTFVIPRAKLPKAFGLTETLGRFRKPAQAKKFVAGVRARLNACEDKDLSTKVTQVHAQGDRTSEVSIWHLSTEISDERTVQFQMAVIRRGSIVVQIGFVPDDDHSIGTGAFHELSLRALERIQNLPRR
ncbi:hypothetical protein [Nocardioides sp. Root151]|uniref:hypothetical protein n=1 Tax=Nocardioides sp. Root151 TaxID=1736475 RepID=UPI000703306F|nr:hypothetical protein [Nocardioides sp. Root151]KQZ67377.1 hypothetical protein ASD66_20730 [Nocardioides sp. Root151]